jgi:hypothetical protein
MSRYSPSGQRVTGDAGGARRCRVAPHLVPRHWCIGTPAECAGEGTKVHNDLLVNSTRSISAPDSGAAPGIQRAQPAGLMRTEAVRAGYCEPVYGERPKVQLLSVAEASRRQEASPAMARCWRVQESRARGSRPWQANKAAALPPLAMDETTPVGSTGLPVTGSGRAFLFGARRFTALASSACARANRASLIDVWLSASIDVLRIGPAGDFWAD